MCRPATSSTCFSATGPPYPPTGGTNRRLSHPVAARACHGALTTSTCRHRSLVRPTDERVPLVAAADRALVDEADAADVELVVDDVGLEGRPLLRQERTVRGHGRHSRVRPKAQDPEVVLGMSLQVLLPEGLPDARPRGHEDTRACARDAGQPGPLAARHLPGAVELGRVLAEVPDGAARVLGVPVGRPLGEPARRVQAVADPGAADTLDDPCPAGDADDVTARLAVLDASVHERRPGPEREPRVVDRPDEAAR